MLENLVKNHFNFKTQPTSRSVFACTVLRQITSSSNHDNDGHYEGYHNTQKDAQSDPADW